MSEVDFSAALDMSPEDVPTPKDPPQGTYTWTVAKPASLTVSKSGEWDIVEFPIQAVSAEEDVDEDAVAEYGDIGSIYNRITFMSPKAEDKDNDRKKTLKRIRTFCERTLQIDDAEGKTLRELLDSAVGHQFLAQILWEPTPENPEENYVNVKNYAPLDD